MFYDAAFVMAERKFTLKHGHHRSIDLEFGRVHSLILSLDRLFWFSFGRSIQFGPMLYLSEELYETF